MADFIFKPSSNGSGVFSNALEFQGFDPAETVNVADGTYDIYQKVVSGFAVTKISAEFALADVGEEPVVTATDGNVSVTIASGVHAGTYTQRAPDGAALTVAMIATSATCFKLPTISGTTNAGDVLTVTPGLWLYEGSDPGDQTWQQKLGGVDVAGGTDLTYVIQPADDGAQFTAEERFGGVTVESGATAIAFGPATVPAAFADANWSVATGGNASELDITIASLPGNGGAAITDIEYDVDASGAWVSLGSAAPGTTTVIMAAPATVCTIRLRAVNSVGTAAAGNSESATSGAALTGFNPYTDDTAAYGGWDASDTGSITGTTPPTAWADQVGSQIMPFLGDPVSGARTQNGLNTIDLDGTKDMARFFNSFTFPGSGSGNFAIHGAVVIDAISDTFDSLLGITGGGATINLRANNGTQFEGRLDMSASVGTSGNLIGGPFSGLTVFSMVFDTSGGQWEVLINGASRGTGPLASGLTAATGTLRFGATHNGSQPIEGALCELIVTETLTNAASYQTYLSDKWTA
ncbi:hypothetical protein ACOTTU_21815 [Roseobacter sp. EG26]|uniref:hypothetical protein n=1 Tax=Roseobacter sp. EG26 TaxID=3412477 RepID=UPI003CE57EDA